VVAFFIEANASPRVGAAKGEVGVGISFSLGEPRTKNSLAVDSDGVSALCLDTFGARETSSATSVQTCNSTPGQVSSNNVIEVLDRLESR
jgi:hypothetical protein